MGILIPEFGKFWPVESGILGFGIQNTFQGFRILEKIGIQNPCSTDKDWNPGSTARNPESKTVLGQDLFKPGSYKPIFLVGLLYYEKFAPLARLFTFLADLLPLISFCSKLDANCLKYPL